MKPRAIFSAILLALVLVAAVVASFSFRETPLPPEPMYKGRTASDWWDHRNAEFYAAFGAMGSNAVPFIYRKIEINNSRPANAYRLIWQYIPTSVRWHLRSPRPDYSDLSEPIEALLACGTNAFPLVTNRLNDRNTVIREVSWMFLAVRISPIGPRVFTTNQLYSLCLPRLHDSSYRARGCAAYFIGTLGSSASNAVPELVKMLRTPARGKFYDYDRANAVKALGKIGPAAASAVPSITPLLTGTNANDFGLIAAVALWNITSNENPSLDIITRGIHLAHAHYNVDAINTLGDMGPRAKPAFPLLTNEFCRPFPQGRSEIATQWFTAASNALIAMNPDAAAKFFASQQPQK